MIGARGFQRLIARRHLHHLHQVIGGQRALRRFAVKFEEYANLAPFSVRIDVIGGVKRYVREGTPS